MPKPLSMLLFGLLLISFTPHALADKYHGEFCWQVFSDSNETLWKYKFGIYEKEGGHFTLYGSIDYGPNGLSASHGNAIFIGDTIKLTIVSTDHEEGDHVWSETFAAKLDKSTLNGTWNALSLENNDKDSGEDVFGYRDRGTINSIACQ